VNEALVLAGGLASRLGDLAAETPKCLQPVAGRPFIDHLLWNVARHGVRRIVLCTGRLHERVEAHVGDGSALGVEVVYSAEPEALGTGGAVALAARHLVGDEALVLNGDSLVDCNYLDLALRRRAAGAAAAIALREVPEAARYGSVCIGAEGVVTAFGEKLASGPGLVSAGAYVASADWLCALPHGVSSLEMDHFPALLAGRGMIAAVYKGFFIDIGVPEALAAAQVEVASWRRKPCVFLDRDGVINVDTGHAHAPGEFAWMEGMPGAIKLLNDAGWLAIVITNQAGIGRGLYSEAEFEAFTRWIDGELAHAGAHVDATYHCPHHPTEARHPYLRACDCRKPAPGLLLRAIAEWEPDIGRSFMLGDKRSDMEAATAAGIRGVLYQGGDLEAQVRALIGG
jgi:D,D-heptose 1,7-bisphosphate phosphatase